MQGKTRSHKPKLELGLDIVTSRKKLVNTSKVVKDVDVTLERCLNVEPIVSPLLGTLEVDAQLEKEANPSKLSETVFFREETVSFREKIVSFREEVPVEFDKERGVDTPVTMAQGGGGIPPIPPAPPINPIDPLVRPRGLPILVPQNLAAVDMPSHLPKFYGTKDEDPSRHMEKYMERLASSLVTNPGYWLVWFPTTLEGEAYEWYRDHAEGHFRAWDQLQREFLNEFRPEVGQSTALRALTSLKQEREEEISAYIRRFDLVCTRFVGTLLNDDTLKQFFIQGFFKAGTIRGILERNPQTLAAAKVAAREMEHIDRDYERLWRREDESIPQFIPIRPRVVEGEPGRHGSQVPHAFIDAGPRPLAVREPAPLLALPAPRVDTHIEEVERRLGASQLGFQEAMIKQMQSLTDQMSLMIRSQQPGPPPPVESGRHASGLWCIQCGQSGHTKQFCGVGQNRDQRNNGGPPPQNPRGQGQNQYGQGNYRGPPPRVQGGQNVERKDFHPFCGRWHAQGQCWSEGHG